MLSDLPFTEVTIVLSPALEMREASIASFAVIYWTRDDHEHADPDQALLSL